jgi:hypothetical protein
MGDLQIGEAFKDKAFIIETATGNPWLLQAPTCTVIDELGNRAVGVVAEESNGWYTCTFTPDAAGTWCTEWALAASTIYSAYKEFKVGGGEVTDIKTETALIYADTNELQTDWANGGRLDVILDVAQGNTTTILAATDAATSTRLAAADIAVSAQNAAANVDVVDVVGNKTDTIAGTSLVSLIKIETAAIAVIDEFHDVPAQNAAANAQINEVVGNKTDTTAGDSLVSLVKIVDGVVDAVKPRTDHLEITKCFFSPQQALVTLSTAHTDAALPTVTLPNITGTITHAYAGIKFRMIENSNAAVNKLSGAQEIQIQAAAEGWLDCIHFVDDQFSLAATTKEGGDCILGYTDVVATVDVFNDTYEFQWDEPLTDQDSIKLHDVQTFLVVSYY